MRNVLLRAAMKLIRNHKYEKWWQRTVRVMGTAVVFCTTYALILPAITMEKEAICGLKAHEHVESCYTQQPICTFACGLDGQEQVVHSHDSLCYDGQGALICLLPELTEHTHDDSCYSQSETAACDYVHVHSAECTVVTSVLVCEQEETSGHAHNMECTTEQELLCQIPESEGHIHDESCTVFETVQICTEAEGETHTHEEACFETKLIPCTIPESEGHVHGEGCYEIRLAVCSQEERQAHGHTAECYTEQETPCDQTTTDGHVHEEGCYPEQLTCEKPNIKLHAHDAISCYSDDGTITCTTAEVKSHAHIESCLVQTEQMQEVLTCQLEEHVHEEGCYPAEEEKDGPYEYTCGSGVHAHVETCHNEAGELTCTIPEHAHEAACIVANLDLTADVETEQQWKASVSGMTLTGNWPGDVLAVAQTQLDYQESEKNLVLADGQLKGYTRYGAWYGEAYGDWNAMFVAFCLNYADVQDFPVESDADSWIAALEEKQLYKTPDTYSPKPGDLVFFDYDQKEDAPEEIPVAADQVAIVAELIPATEEEPAQIKVIAGDYEDQVRYVTCDMDDVTIVGYAAMPVGNNYTLTYEGADFTVTVALHRDTGIPDTAQLAVREILAGTEEYDTYYQQSVDALMGSMAEDEETPEISFARFFDISFLVDGVAVEPTAPVDVQIRYSDVIEKKEEEDGMVVHFAQNGVEVLDADIYSADPAQTGEDTLLTDLVELFTGETEQVDTFAFTQNSFSVVGTVLTDYTRAITATMATTVDFNAVDVTGETLYVIYTEYNGSYYAITSNSGDVTGYSEPVTVNADGTITWTTDNSNIFWSFESNGGNSYYVQNYGSARYIHAFDNSTANNSDYGTTTGGRNPSTLTRTQDGRFTARGNNYYTALVDTNGTITFNRVSNQNQAARFYVAEVGSFHYVWFDGTNGGMMSYYGADDLNIPAAKNADGTPTVIALPETWNSSTKYEYTLQGWYDINSHTYYPVDPADDVEVTAEISGNTVFYADWVAATYDVGQNNSDVVDSVDTSDFITTYVFDYNALFNVQSLIHTGTISATDHSETWTIVNNGTVPYNNADSLGFAFIDYDSDGEFSYPLGRDETNINQGDAVTDGILTEVQNTSGKNLLDLLFNPDIDVIGKNYVGTGNYLFQYMDSTTENYDGEHDGYYYLDARLNAASYNQSLQRFYVYDYLERTSDSNKDGGVGQYSDFLPFNSPYLFEADQLDEYTDTIRRPGYEYDAKDGISGNYPEYNSTDDAATNYFFGIRTDIEFFLPNNTNTQDEYGNYGNISTRGEHMVFDFHGDDDVWVFVDGELLLDIGGLHGVMFGQIDFSTGTITVGKDGGTTETTSFNLSEGTHTMTVYYMERGSSQSNCAIYFNIAPRYDLEITKEDIVSAEKLDGAVFTIYNDEAMTSPAQLWDSEEAYNADLEDGTIDEAKSTFEVVDGIAKCWGISAGKTYYIYETTPPPGYPESDDIIRITLNNRGTATIETTTLHGSNGIATEGFAVIKQEINETLKIVALTVTNQKEGDHTEVRVEKDWAAGSNLPQSISVFLTRDGERFGRTAVLNEGNGWAYTWTGLDKYRVDGIDEEIVYEVQEVLVPGFITTQGETQKVVDYVDWIRVDQMSDSKTFLLVHNGQALTYDGAFGWMDPAAAELDTSLSAQWSVTTDHDGFHLKNGLGYTLTYGSNGFYGTQNDANELNQVFYYLNNRLVVHDHDVYFQFGTNGSVVSSDGLAFTLYQKEVMTGLLTNIINEPVVEEDQTYVEVTKVWSDGADKHATQSVEIHLLADGEDTGRSVILNAANNWSGSFQGLPYYRAGGTDVIRYTVEESVVTNYLPSYSDPQVLPGVPFSVWTGVTELSEGTFRFSYSGSSLGVSGSDVVSLVSNTEDTYQQWTLESSDSGYRLKNVGSNHYLSLSNGTLSTTTRSSSAATVSMTNNKIKIGTSYYLELSASHVGVSTNSSNATMLMVSKWVQGEGRPGTGYTVTNRNATYELPKTGGPGPFFFLTFGSMLMMTAACVYFVTQFGRKRQKGGRYSR